jgi:hypothetical protein
MGICIGRLQQNNNVFTYNKVTINNIKRIFKSYNVLDTHKNIIVGVWDNPNQSNELSNQGIWIEGYDQIYELIFGIIVGDLVILYFKNDIVLKIAKEKITRENITFTLEIKNKKNDMFYSTDIDGDIIRKINKINDNSSDLDLIYNLVSK